MFFELKRRAPVFTVARAGPAPGARAGRFRPPTAEGGRERAFGGVSRAEGTVSASFLTRWDGLRWARPVAVVRGVLRTGC